MWAGKANGRLTRPLAEIQKWLTPAIRPFVTVLYFEDIVAWPRYGTALQLRAHYDEYAARYMPSIDPA